VSPPPVDVSNLLLSPVDVSLSLVDVSDLLSPVDVSLSLVDVSDLLSPVDVSLSLVDVPDSLLSSEGVDRVPEPPCNL
jgi:hypothetical protein